LPLVRAVGRQPCWYVHIYDSLLALLDRIKKDSLVSIFQQVMSPALATIFTPQILYLYLTIKTLKNPNPLRTIPAHQPQHHHHLSLSMVTILTSSTLNMSNEIFTSGQGYLPKPTDENKPIWKQQICHILSAKMAYNNVTGVDLHSFGNIVALHTLQGDWHHQINTVIALIHI